VDEGNGKLLADESLLLQAVCFCLLSEPVANIEGAKNKNAASQG
jgi:hypothetical protein